MISLNTIIQAVSYDSAPRADGAVANWANAFPIGLTGIGVEPGR